ncbi:MAG: thiamine diphosphokinase [Balneola sp.]|jgi:thiamine pyrophosphokinase
MHALIICGGTPPTKALLENHIKKADLQIGADSGGHVFLGYGFTPDIVLGDLDSFKYTNHENIEVLKLDDQNSTDLDKALNYALKKGATSCSVLGALGKRIDHQQKNLSSLVEFHDRFESLVFEDDYGKTFLADSPFEKDIPLDTTISFFPVSGFVENFISSGVLYPLNNVRLEPGVQDATSNTVTASPVTLEFSSGKLAVFIGDGSKIK